MSLVDRKKQKQKQKTASGARADSGGTVGPWKSIPLGPRGADPQFNSPARCPQDAARRFRCPVGGLTRGLLSRRLCSLTTCTSNPWLLQVCPGTWPARACGEEEPGQPAPRCLQVCSETEMGVADVRAVPRSSRMFPG